MFLFTLCCLSINGSTTTLLRNTWKVASYLFKILYIVYIILCIVFYVYIVQNNERLWFFITWNIANCSVRNVNDERFGAGGRIQWSILPARRSARLYASPTQAHLQYGHFSRRSQHAQITGHAYCYHNWSVFNLSVCLSVCLFLILSLTLILSQSQVCLSVFLTL